MAIGHLFFSSNEVNITALQQRCVFSKISPYSTVYTSEHTPTHYCTHSSVITSKGCACLVLTVQYVQTSDNCPGVTNMHFKKKPDKYGSSCVGWRTAQSSINSEQLEVDLPWVLRKTYPAGSYSLLAGSSGSLDKSISLNLFNPSHSKDVTRLLRLGFDTWMAFRAFYLHLSLEGSILSPSIPDKYR